MGGSGFCCGLLLAGGPVLEPAAKLVQCGRRDVENLDVGGELHLVPFADKQQSHAVFGKRRVYAGGCVPGRAAAGAEVVRGAFGARRQGQAQGCGLRGVKERGKNSWSRVLRLSAACGSEGKGQVPRDGRTESDTFIIEAGVNQGWSSPIIFGICASVLTVHLSSSIGSSAWSTVRLGSEYRLMAESGYGRRFQRWTDVTSG